MICRLSQLRIMIRIYTFWFDQVSKKSGFYCNFPRHLQCLQMCVHFCYISYDVLMYRLLSLPLHVVKVKTLAFKCYSPWSSKWTQSEEDFTKNMGQETKTVCLREKDRRGGVRMSFFLVRTVFTTLRAVVSLVHGFYRSRGFPIV